MGELEMISAVVESFVITTFPTDMPGTIVSSSTRFTMSRTETDPLP